MELIVDQIPFNNSCEVNTHPTRLTNLNTIGGGFASLRMNNLDTTFRQPLQHVKTTLPPTLTAFPGLAEIRYYLKVTVNRKEFYKENPRVVSTPGCLAQLKSSVC